MLPRGQILLDWLAENKLISANSFCQHVGRHIWTFESNLGHRREIDYIFVQNRYANIYGDVSGLLHLGSDHRLVRAVLRCKSWSRKFHCKSKSMKGWAPWINENGFDEDYHECLDVYLLQDMPSNFEEIESCILCAAKETDLRQSSKSRMPENNRVDAKTTDNKK